MNRSTVVERVERPTVDEFRERWLVPQRPVVMTGTLDDWPALAKWDVDHVRATAGSARLRVETIPDAGEPGYFGRKSLPGQMELGEYLTAVFEGRDVPRLYMGGIPAPSLPTLAGDIRMPVYVVTEHKPVPYLWFGAAGAVTQLHFDINNNFHALFRGRKRFVLFAPSDSARLYPKSVFDPRRHFSRVQLEAPDLESFPRFAEAEALEVTIEPGDLLFLPSLWWHQVETVEPSIAANWWWGKNRWGPKNFLYLRELPLIWYVLGSAGLRRRGGSLLRKVGLRR